MIVKRFLLRLAVAAGIVLAPAIVPAHAAQQVAAERTLVVSGSSTMFPLVSDIARRFERAHPDTTIEVHSGGSGRGVVDLRSGTADVAMVSRPLGANERDLFAFPLCRDGAAIVVHRSNPVKSLGSRQLAALLMGEITDWKALGGRPGPVRVAWRTEGQAIPDILLQHLKLKPEQIRSHAVFFENIEAVRYVEKDPQAVTFAALGVAETAAKSGVAVRLVAYEGVAAAARTLRDHSYVLSRPLILATRAVPSGLQKRFIDYAQSNAVVDLHEKYGFVSYHH